MNKGLIVIGHGTKVAETDQIMSRYIEAIAQKTNFEQVEKAYLQLMNPSLEEAVHKLFAAGIRLIVVFPFFLFNGYQTGEKLPKLLKKLEGQYEGIHFELLDVIGYDEQFALLVSDKIEAYTKGNI